MYTRRLSSRTLLQRPRYGEKGFSSWWCIDDVDNSKAYNCVVYDLRSGRLTSNGGYKGHGMSVRCIKNK